MAISLRFPWATDDNFAGGAAPWSGDPNKVAPSTARAEEGWPPNVEPAASHFNYLFNKIGLLIDSVAEKISYRNWHYAVIDDTATTPLGTLNVARGSAKGFMLAVANTTKLYITSWKFWNNPGNDDGDPGNGAELWEIESDVLTELTWAGGSRAGLGIYDTSGTYVETVVVSNGDVDQVAHRNTLFAAWVERKSGLSGAVSWSVAAYGTPGMWIIAGGPNIAYTTNPANPGAVDWTEVLAVTTGDYLFAESNKLAGAAHRFVLGTTIGEISTSADGITWATQTPGTAVDIYGATYDGLLGRWVAVANDGTIFISDDNAATWTQYASRLSRYPTIGTPIPSIASNDRGTIVVTVNAEYPIWWVSFDSGDTFERIHFDDQAETVGSDHNDNNMHVVAFAGGQFGMIGTDVAMASLVGDI